MLRLHRKQDEQMDETVKKFDIVPVQSVIWIGDEKIEIDVDERGFQRARKADEDPHLYFVNDRIRAAFVHQLGDKFRKLTYKEQEEMINRKKYGDEGYERRQEKDKNMFTSSHSDRKKTYERIRKKNNKKNRTARCCPQTKNPRTIVKYIPRQVQGTIIGEIPSRHCSGRGAMYTGCY